LSQVVSRKPVHDAPDRLPTERYEELYAALCQTGVALCRDGNSERRLRDLRRLYEPYAEALSRYFVMPLPPWIATEKRKDNWLVVAKVRAQAESTNPSSEDPPPSEAQIRKLQALYDDHHEF